MNYMEYMPRVGNVEKLHNNSDLRVLDMVHL